jgi:3'-5' exoribonuclease
VPIAELAEDRVVEGLFAVASKRRLRTRSGSPYLALELVDPTGKIEARVWNDVELLDKRFGEGDAATVSSSRCARSSRRRPTRRRSSPSRAAT